MNPVKFGLFAVASAMIFATGSAVSAQTQTLDVPVMERADEDLDTCAFGEVTGLNPNGDTYLAVHSGPGTNYRRIDKLRSNVYVWTFEEKGSWIGVVYGSDDIECSPITADRPYDGPGKVGWVHKNYIHLIAG